MSPSMLALVYALACGGGEAPPAPEAAAPPEATPEAAPDAAPVAAPEAAPADSPAPAAALHTPEKGSAERTAILDALRAKVRPEFKRDAIFVVDTLNVAGGFAWLVAQPKEQDGSDFDFSTTAYAQDLQEGLMDGSTTYALLEYDNGAWTALEVAVAPTDVAWEGWDVKHGAPKEIWGS